MKNVRKLSKFLSTKTRMDGLVRHVDVAQESAGVYVGRSLDLGWGRVYGGQTMAQGLAACHRLIGPERTVHHVHSLFLRGGDVHQDLRFEAEQLAAGRSFSAVHVRALQGGKVVLAMTASLQAPESGFEHQLGGLQPEWGRPDELRSIASHMAPHLDRVPAALRGLYVEDMPLELRPSEFIAPWDRAVRPPQRALWVRATTPLPDDPRLHQRLLTYVSDWGMLETPLYAHDALAWGREVQMASLSHSLHFHQPFALDRQWLCHVVHSPVASGGRGFALGQVWTEGGVLVASTAQEGLIRPRPDGERVWG